MSNRDAAHALALRLFGEDAIGIEAEVDAIAAALAVARREVLREALEVAWAHATVETRALVSALEALAYQPSPAATETWRDSCPDCDDRIDMGGIVPCPACRKATP